ncbi:MULTISPECIES: YfgM family protein [Acinetobacter]|jgi:predicted negative regulator of RcsB-dependent stress response|uniref:Ancillary SecYEG translocon subunit n=2 Tax=Acinetobacter TaxID=469 RepID=A0A4Q7B391_9GAMM|nr:MULTISPECIES: tetratricopeptide repeat protein [Acinetobacter]MCW8038725.1 tetratricopeptide repeat protein [Acinetobacter entericus]QXW25555.1 tetratricopeptide repeat protein [Acinetobacter johnsonii]RZG69762.1 tetratricopeptide repeat protein [Acinetobacter bouvetii]
MNALSDDEQLDNLKSFSKKYGSAIISGILIALIAFFGWEYWQKKTLAESQTATAKVQQLMDSAKSAQGDAFSQLSTSADSIMKEAPDSPQAIQAQLVMAKLAYDKADYASAEKALKKVENVKAGDDGLIQIVKLRLAYAQLAQKKYDEALKTLEAVTDPAFKATADEARGDVYVAKNDIENAKKVYQSAWDALVERKEERQILQIKLESVGVLVDDPEIERPILETQVEETE